MKTTLTKFSFAAVVLLSTFILPPSSVRALPVVTAVSCGGEHSLFLKSDGSLWTMGDNFYGQLGIGFAPAKTNVPQEVLSSGVGAVAAGGVHSLFRTGSSLWAMGFNAYGQLGDATTNNKVFPEKVFSGSASLAATVIAAGGQHSLFGTSGFVSGSTGLRVMGNNSHGQLGDGATTNHDTPEEVVSTAISSIAGGTEFSLFVKMDGSLWGMGNNTSGQLGNGGTMSTNRPVQIEPSGVTAVAAGTFHSLFIKSDGSLWGMGLNESGELGDNTTSEHNTPEQIAFNGVTAIAAGAEFSLYIKSDGSLWGMGNNFFGQLGDGTTNQHHLAFQIVASNVVAVAAGENHSLFIKSDGSLWGMGANASGQLGEGSFTNHLTPVEIVAGLPPTPRITGISLSGANLNLDGANGVSGETLYTLMSATLAEPLSQWQPVATNVLNATGNFTIIATNAVNPNAGQRFYILQVQ
jgi:alpha-tubulin suppressor-like RCC1 family protein